MQSENTRLYKAQEANSDEANAMIVYSGYYDRGGIMINMCVVKICEITFWRG